MKQNSDRHGERVMLKKVYAFCSGFVSGALLVAIQRCDLVAIFVLAVVLAFNLWAASE